jgi:predicted nucleic-acid-binding Zn-ribbon protein
VKSTGTCPKCQGRRLFHVTNVQHTYCDAMGSLRSFQVTSAEIKTGKKGLLGGDAAKIESAGPYETFVCAGCGYAEWHASTSALRALESMVAGAGTIRLIGGAKPAR